MRRLDIAINSIEAMATIKRRHPDGIALEAEQIIKNSNGSLGDAATSSESIDHLFITMVRSLRNLSFFVVALFLLAISPHNFSSSSASMLVSALYNHLLA